ERKVARIAGIFVVTLAVGIAVGAFYESIEWFEDKFLGGHFVGGLWDTETDLLCDEGGSLIGAAFLTVWALHGWSSRRTTVVPVPAPGETPVEAAAGRLRSRRSMWLQRIGGLPRVVQGAAAVTAGVVLFALPSPSLRTVGVIIGIVLLVSAAVEIVELARHHDPAKRIDRLIATVALAVAGGVVLVWPEISQLALLYVVRISAGLFSCFETL